jgi:hypothetical protein
MIIRRIAEKIQQSIDNSTPTKDTYAKAVLTEEQGNQWIYYTIKKQSPLMVSRLGDTELRCIYFHKKYRQCKTKKRYHLSIVGAMNNNAGFFPPTEHMLDQFCELFLSSIEQADGMGIWYNSGEDIILKEFAPNAELFPLRSIEPFYHKNPWSEVLERKKVLVIHPFSDSIISQYKKREHLFENKNILPQFTLITLKAVQSIAGIKTEYNDWFEALNSMKKEMNNTEFDIAIIGAGAYGLPLAAHAKHLGKQAIHMGGGTQVLFGIRGRRWDKHEFISKLYNPYWIRPSKTERGGNIQNVENGCYW